MRSLLTHLALSLRLGARASMLLSAGVLAVVLAACGASSGTGSPGGTGFVATSPDALNGQPLRVRDFTLDPLAMTASGGAVSLAVTNDGPTIHNVTIRDSSGRVIAATKDLQPGASESLSTTLPPGTYVLFCSLPGHESLGIRGTLTVKP